MQLSNPAARWKMAAGQTNNAMAAVALLQGEKRTVGRLPGAAGGGKPKEVSSLASKHGMHSFAESETEAFTTHVNDCLKDDVDCRHLLPIPEGTMEIFETVRRGTRLGRGASHTRRKHLARIAP